MLVGLVDDEVDGSEVGFVGCGRASGLVRLVVDGHRGSDGVGFRAFGDVHLDAVDGEAHVRHRAVVHRCDGERELSHVVADIVGGVVDGRRLDGFLLACCEQNYEAA